MNKRETKILKENNFIEVDEQKYYFEDFEIIKNDSIIMMKKDVDIIMYLMYNKI